MTKKSKRFLIIGVAVVVIVLLALTLSMDTEQGMTVQADEAKQRDLIETVSASGRVQPETKVEITSEITGEIIALRVKEGDTVSSGQLLIVLDTIQLRSDVDQSRYALNELGARLEGAGATLEQNDDEYKRQQRLFEGNLTSETALKNSKYAYLNSKAMFDAIEAQASQARARHAQQLDRLSKAKMLAPMSGVVTYVNCEVGEIAPAETGFTQGKVLVTISNLEVFEVEVEVDETEITKLDLQQTAQIEIDAFPDTTFKGRVVEIGNTAILSGLGTQEQSTNFRVRVVFEDRNAKIRPGMSATVDITTASREETVTVPYSAIVIRSMNLDSLMMAREGGAQGSGSTVVNEVHAAEGDTSQAKMDETMSGDETEREEIKGVFVIRDGKVEFVPVETGIADQKFIEVTKGLLPGDSVVSGPYRALRNVNDGDAVKIEKTTERNRG